MKRGPGRAATIVDVATAAGVSTAAVSKVLRDAYGVSDAMRARVNAAIAELDYRPRVAARAMRGQTFTIGIELPNFDDGLFARILSAVLDAFESTPYEVVVAPARGHRRTGAGAIETLVDRQVDGVIALSPSAGQGAIERVARHTPIVVLGRDDATTMYDTVVSDDGEGARAVMRHLFDLGHRRIAHVTVEGAESDRTSARGIRLQAYRAEMAAHGRAADAGVVYLDEHDRSASLARLLTVRPAPTAVFAASDQLAIDVQQVAAESGARVAVAGFDDVPIAAHPSVGLTTVRQPGAEMGARAAALLLERIAGRVTPVHDVFAPSLVARASTLDGGRAGERVRRRVRFGQLRADPA